MALPVALQLYSVRGDLETDFEGTLQKVKKMGYQRVELSGLNDGNDPKEVKKIIDGCGLEIMSSHVPFAKMLENPQKVFEAYTAVGCKYIVIPWLDANEALCEENFAKTVQKITDIGKAARQNGLTLLYHNHNFEFEKRGGKYLLDLLYSSVRDEYLKTQLDTCWVKVGGGVAGSFDLLEEHINAGLNSCIFKAANKNCTVAKTALRYNAALLGCSAICQDERRDTI